MLPPIQSLLETLKSEHGAALIHGRYTGSTIQALARHFVSEMHQAGRGYVFGGISGPASLWPEWASPNDAVVMQRLEFAPTVEVPDSIGIVLCGVGSMHMFMFCGMSVEPDNREWASQTFDATWSLEPAHVVKLLDIVEQFMEGYPSALPNTLIEAREHLVHYTPDLTLTRRFSEAILHNCARDHTLLATENQDLRNRLRWREDQARMIVHDMRSSLHTLLMSVESLMRRKINAEGQRELLGVADESVKYLLEMTETILTVAQLEANSWDLQMEAIDARTLIEKASAPFAVTAALDRIRFRYMIDDTPASLWGDRSLMTRVLHNLLSNAVKFTTADGEIVITLRPSADGQSAELSVHDNGIGIDSKSLPHIFSRFFQASKSDRRYGMGLGLYFCRLAMEAQGGAIWADSTPNKGSTFTVTLPLDTQTIEAG